MKALVLTPKGREEIKNPGKREKIASWTTTISDEERRLFSEFSFALEKYTDEQKKAIVCQKENILCIAGAGSGKTEVLTKRISFLVQYRGVLPENILAITFTRKAREEMQKRLDIPVHVHTFNSFCERLLVKYQELAYGRQVKVVEYRDKIRLLRTALLQKHLDLGKAIDVYFSPGQKRGKTAEELAAIFMNDCFYYRSRAREKIIPVLQEESAKLIRLVAEGIDDMMKKEGLRDFDDQIVDALQLLKDHQDTRPSYAHVLVDEYQDINAKQEELLEILSPKNLFCVGDPRQSIFGWRGSKIDFILGFPEKHGGAEVVALTKNFRSSRHIVALANATLRHMRLPDLQSEIDGEKDVKLLQFENDDGEAEFVIQRILASGIPKQEIFVLGRTNKQLLELAERCAVHKIPYQIRSDELKRKADVPDAVTLATIHAIKGMEAEMVFVTGVTTQNFPCRGSDHPIIDLIREEYDREEEERRLLYVALSRAKKSLYLSFSGKGLTRYVTEEMKGLVGFSAKSVKAASPFERLRDWRREKAMMLGVPPYMIMHDRVLLEIVEKDPSAVGDLYEISGLGPAKAKRYGNEILQTLLG
jgi:DNA helicase-2/ATP-dependent DNA helicase PcrA